MQHAKTKASKRRAAKKWVAAILLFVVAAGAATLVVLGFRNANTLSNTKTLTPLRFQGSTFKMVQFSDFHAWAGEEDGSFFGKRWDTLDPQLEKYINDVLDAEKPDLVVLTGDNAFPLLVTSELVFATTKRTYKRFGEIFAQRKQPFTLTFGNHDEDSIFKKTALYNAVKSNPYFYGGDTDTDAYAQFQFVGKTDGKRDTRVGNFSLPVYHGDKLAFQVHLLDSGSYYLKNEPKNGGYRYVLPEQTAWLKEVLARRKWENGGQGVPSVLFTHIPLWEHAEAYQQGGEQIGTWAGISPSKTRSDLFEMAFASRDILGIFVGHNHENSLTTFYERDGHKVMMGITPQATADEFFNQNGGMRSRVITVQPDGNFETYIHSSKENGTENKETLRYR